MMTLIDTDTVTVDAAPTDDVTTKKDYKLCAPIPNLRCQS